MVTWASSLRPDATHTTHTTLSKHTRESALWLGFQTPLGPHISVLSHCGSICPAYFLGSPASSEINVRPLGAKFAPFLLVSLI